MLDIRSLYGALAPGTIRSSSALNNYAVRHTFPEFLTSIVCVLLWMIVFVSIRYNIENKRIYNPLTQSSIAGGIFCTVFNSFSSVVSRNYFLPTFVEELSKASLNSCVTKKENSVNLSPSIRSKKRSLFTNDLPKNRVRHLGLIMDGNRRYGKRFCALPSQGHIAGAQKLLEVLDWCLELDITTITAFAFSTENWNRDPNEIEVLLDVLESYIPEMQDFAAKHHARVRFLITDRGKIPDHIQELMCKLEKITESHSAMTINLCVSYGARSEILNAVYKIAQKAIDDPHYDISSLTEKSFESYLATRGNQDPDLILRTSGEQRMSNFLLWQGCFSELFFEETLWPQLTRDRFRNIVLKEYPSRSRRWGR